MSQPPEYLFGEIASEIDLAYAAGWKAREQQMIDQLSDTMKRMAKQRAGEPPEVYP